MPARSSPLAPSMDVSFKLRVHLEFLRCCRGDLQKTSLPICHDVSNRHDSLGVGVGHKADGDGGGGQTLNPHEESDLPGHLLQPSSHPRPSRNISNKPATVQRTSPPSSLYPILRPYISPKAAPLNPLLVGKGAVSQGGQKLRSHGLACLQSPHGSTGVPPSPSW